MKILLDECVPFGLTKLLVQHECSTAQRLGWGGLENGDLIARADGEFDVFVTADQNLRYQQNLLSRQIAILELSTNNFKQLRASVDLVVQTLEEIEPGQFVRLAIPLAFGPMR